MHSCKRFAGGKGGHQSVVELLLDHRAKPDLSKPTSQVLNGDEATANLFLQWEQIQTLQARLIWGALQAASYAGHNENVQLPRNCGAEICASGGSMGMLSEQLSFGGRTRLAEFYLHMVQVRMLRVCSSTAPT